MSDTPDIPEIPEIPDAQIDEMLTNLDDSDDAEGEAQIVVPFDPDLIRKYPRANRKIGISVSTYSIGSQSPEPDGQSVFISPHGLEFRTAQSYTEGTLLKIEVTLPDYWERKQRFVEYGRIDRPANFKILAKVVKSENIGKRGKKKAVIAQTIIIDEVDEKVLKSYLQEG